MKRLAEVLPVFALSLLITIVAVTHAAGAEPDDGTSFMQIVNDDSGQPASLQAAIVSYVPKAGDSLVTVDLISALHVADPSYYAELNRRFDTYDALLYELIADGQRHVPYDSDSKSAVSGIQIMLKQVLGLSFQLEEIDYDRDHFVHADFSPGELAAAMEERDESLYTYFWRTVYFVLSETARDPFGIQGTLRLLDSARSDSNNRLKLSIAREFVAGRGADFLAGPDGSAIIESRNQRAIDVLEAQLAAGKRRIGIFYGAAHMPDLERRLTEQLGFEPEGLVWIDAWDLR